MPTAAFSHLVTSSPYGFHFACEKLNDLMDVNEGSGAAELVRLSPKLYVDGLSAIQSDKILLRKLKLCSSSFTATLKRLQSRKIQIAMALDLNTSLSRLRYHAWDVFGK